MSSWSVGLNRKPRGRELRVKTAIEGEKRGDGLAKIKKKRGKEVTGRPERFFVLIKSE